MRIKLNEPQQEVLDVIKEDKKQFGIYFDMGVGKTALILSLIEYLVFDKLETTNTLILAPATVANELEVWQDEIQKWENFDYFDYFDLSGTPKKRRKKLERKKDNSIVIMSDSLLLWWEKEYGNLDMFDMIVVDESSRFKSQKAKKFKKLAKMIDLKKHRVYELSGTPMPQGHQDLWSQIYLLDKGERLGKSYWKFLDRFFTTYNYRKYITKNNKKILLNLVKDICVFTSSDKVKLPPKEEIKVFLKFSTEKQLIFNNFKRDYVLALEDKDVTVLSKQILINKCLQLANGCIYHDKKGNYSFFDDTKLDYIKKYSEDHPEENILLFYSFRFDRERLLKLPGAQAIKDTQSKNLWNEGKIKIGVISPYAFQYGGNLQYGGYTIIWYGLVWSLENVLQSNKRIWRQGQEHAVKIIYLLMDKTWDDYVYKTVVTKEINQQDFLNSIDIKKMKKGEQ